MGNAAAAPVLLVEGVVKEYGEAVKTRALDGVDLAVGPGELTATVMKEGLVRADDLPLVFKALGCEPLPRGSHVKVRITGLDEMTLDVHATLIERLDEAAPADESEGDDEELEAAAAPLTLAIDVNEAEPAEAASQN